MLAGNRINAPGIGSRLRHNIDHSVDFAEIFSVKPGNINLQIPLDVEFRVAFVAV